MDEFILKIISTLGVPGLVTYCGYKLLDKHATRFLDVSERQAKAIEGCAASMTDQRGESREILTAIRVLTRMVEETTEAVVEKAAEKSTAARVMGAGA